MFTAKIIFVRGVMARAKASVSTLSVSGLTSTTRALSPSCQSGAQVVDHATAGTNTSSPRTNGLRPRKKKAVCATRFALEPELTIIAKRAPTLA